MKDANTEKALISYYGIFSDNWTPLPKYIAFTIVGIEENSPVVKHQTQREIGHVDSKEEVCIR